MPLPHAFRAVVALTLAASALPAHAAGADEAAIRKGRAAMNAAIAAHDITGSMAQFTPDLRVLTSGGELFDGAPAMRTGFERSFADPAFVTYVRTPTQVVVGADGVAAEFGEWRAVWRAPRPTARGVYLARWARTDGGWKIKSEQYIPLGTAPAK